jgi:hypothetical protein
MDSNESASGLGVVSAAMRSGDKARAAMNRHATTARYWIYLRRDGVYWTVATGRDAARSAAGDVARYFELHTNNAGIALRACQMKAAQKGVSIVNLPELEALAQKDPEPESETKSLWLQKNKGVK